MPTRIYTSFMTPNNDSLVEEKAKFWMDVSEDFETVFNQVHPLTAPASSLEVRKNFCYTKLEDGLPFVCPQQYVMGFEAIE